MESIEKKDLIEEFKTQWKSMWQNRVDDKTRAEGIADKDYSLLFVEKGTVIIATRNFRLLDFYELLQQHRPLANGQTIHPTPSVGGWGRFIRTTLMSNNRAKHIRQMSSKPAKGSAQQLKKNGRGWLHFRS